MKFNYDYPSPIRDGKWAARFIFVAGRLCVDFAQTGGKTPERAVWERLHTPQDLAEWFLISPLRLPGVSVSEAEFETALELREAIWCAVNAVRLGQAPEQAVVDTINRIAAVPDLLPEFERQGFNWNWRPPYTASAALSTISRDVIDLLSGELRGRIRKCENPKCALIFVDQSRPGKRRWCLMERCGNLQKTARYREHIRLANKSNSLNSED